MLSMLVAEAYQKENLIAICTPQRSSNTSSQLLPDARALYGRLCDCRARVLITRAWLFDYRQRVVSGFTSYPRNNSVSCIFAGNVQYPFGYITADFATGRFCERGGQTMSRTKHILSYSIPIVILLFFLFGSFFAPHDPTATNIRGKYLSSSAEYPFGTDDFGRCEFSRILEGGKITLGIVLVGSAIVILLGIFFGILLAKTGRRRNILAESILNAVTAIPPVAYLIIFIGIWGNSIPTMLVALTASLVLRMIKLVKTLIEGEYDKAYIMCAIACGASKMRIMLVHILPNIIRDIVQFICLSCAEMIIAISGFSFIGLSLGDDVIDWGVMLSDARALAGTHPQLLFYPIFFILSAPSVSTT